MKRIYSQDDDVTNLPRKRRSGDDGNDGRSNCSPCEDTSDDRTEWRRPEQVFTGTAERFFDRFRDSVVSMITTGGFNRSFLNGSLVTLSNEMTAVLPSRTNQITDAHAARDYAATTKQWLVAAWEANVLALYDRIADQLAWLTSRHTPDGSPNCGSPTPTGSVARTLSPPPSSSVMVRSLSPFETIDKPTSLSGSVVKSQPSPYLMSVTDKPASTVISISGSGERVAAHEGLPAFLAALKPKHDGFDGRRCRQCRVSASLVPVHWSDTLHRMLHLLRGASMPPPRFVNHPRITSYRVIKINQDKYNDDRLRGIREYVDTELGVSETGIRRNTRSAYLSVLSNVAESVVGYLEVEPATVAYVLGSDGQLSSTDVRRRRVKYGASRLWVAVGFRRQGIGTAMLNEFRADRSVLGRHVAFAPHEIQFGDAFVRHYCSAAAAKDAAAVQQDSVAAAARAEVLIYTSSPAWYR